MSCAFSPAVNIRAPTVPLCSQPLVGLQEPSASIHECQWVPFFFPQGGIRSLIFASISTSMSDAILSECPSAAICHMAPNVGEGSTSAAIPPTSASDSVGQHNKIGGITFRAALIHVHDIHPQTRPCTSYSGTAIPTMAVKVKIALMELQYDLTDNTLRS